MRFSIKVDGIKNTQKSLSKFDRDVRTGIIREVAKTTYGLQSDVQNDAPIGATTDLKRSVRANVIDMAGEVWTRLKYAVGVEKGQPPGTRPHVGDLMKWVEKVLGVSKRRLRSVTYLVWRKINTKGTDPQPFFEPNVRIHEKKFYNNIRRLIRRL